MLVKTLNIPDVLLFEPKVFSDPRGYFFESFNNSLFNEYVGRRVDFVQDNRSYSKQAVLRGLHYQIAHTQGKLVSVLSGEVFDVAVDLRQSSPTFGQWVGEFLSADNRKQLWIPEGFAHGFLVISESAEFYYKVTDYWSPQHERCIRFDDPTLSISWPKVVSSLQQELKPILSDKDREGQYFAVAECFV